MGEIRVDHAAVTDHRHPVAPVAVDDLLDGADDVTLELRLGGEGVDAGPTVDDHLPTGVTGGLQLLDRDVLLGVPVVLGDAVGDHDLDAMRSADRGRGLTGSLEGAGVDGVDVLGGKIRGEQVGLGQALWRQFRVGCSGRHLSSDRQGVANEDQLHMSTR